MASTSGVSTTGPPIPHRTPQRRKGLRESFGDKGAPLNEHRIHVDSGMDGYQTVISKAEFLEIAKGGRTAQPPRHQYVTPEMQGMKEEDFKKPEKLLYSRLVRHTLLLPLTVSNQQYSVRPSPVVSGTNWTKRLESSNLLSPRLPSAC